MVSFFAQTRRHAPRVAAGERVAEDARSSGGQKFSPTGWAFTGGCPTAGARHAPFANEVGGTSAGRRNSCEGSQQGAHDEMFAFLPQKHLSNLRLYLTDARGRKLGRFGNTQSKTAFGNGTAQSVTGNLFFMATIRIDTIMRSPPTHLVTQPVPRPLNSKDTGPQLALARQ